MKTLIIEDEKAALRNLKAVINEVSAGLEIIGETDSIVDTIGWFQTHPMPELVFMDIHLADGSAFEVFEHVEVKCPIIFTTAYDEYALRAVDVNSIAGEFGGGGHIRAAGFTTTLDKNAIITKLEELVRAGL